MRLTHMLALAALLAFGAASHASDPIGIYALIDKVVLEPDGQTPERIQLWGAFSLPESETSLALGPPVRGYMYYALPKDKVDLCRREWVELKNSAGTRSAVAFASRFQANGRVRKANEEPKAPDVYPIAYGVYTIRNANHYVRQLRSLPAPISPREGEQVAPGAVTLRTGNILGNDGRPVKYLFEIENGSGDKETSTAVVAGGKETSWSPRMQVKAGAKYSWRVWVLDGTNAGPIASTAFHGKSVQ